MITVDQNQSNNDYEIVVIYILYLFYKCFEVANVSVYLKVKCFQTLIYQVVIVVLIMLWTFYSTNI